MKALHKTVVTITALLVAMAVVVLSGLAGHAVFKQLQGPVPVDERALETASEPDIQRTTERDVQRLSEHPLSEQPTPHNPSRGAYLMRAGNCAACHTARGGQPFAGGRAIETPFGTVYSSNITPDSRTGIGAWTAGDFWRAMHHGQSKDGRLLYPAFPYTEYTRISRDDSDAMFAYLQTVQPVSRANQPHALRFPYNTQVALAAWRVMFFTPARFTPASDQSEAWNRGAYLVTVLGHCQACHAPRNRLGALASDAAMQGGQIPMQNWYAPSLLSPAEGGVQDWPLDEIAQWLKTGKTARHSALGPMAEVVFSSTQYLTDQDLSAMSTYLKALPQQDPDRQVKRLPAEEELLAGRRIYQDNCAQCHGDQGEGKGPYPPMAGNRTVLLHSSANLVRIILVGGFTPATQGNPRPHGMPPYGHALSDADIAAVATFVRNAWGNRAGVVMPYHVEKAR